MQWLAAAIGLILLIALFNAATLQFARISRRWKDFGIRSALGANTFQLAGELLIESLLLTSMAALLGFALFSGIFTFVTQNWPEEIPGVHDFNLLALRPLLLLAAGILASALVLSGLSLWFMHRLHVVDRLNLGQEAVPLASLRMRLNGALVSVQLTAATVLLICAALLTSSFIHAVSIDLGYRPDGVLAARIELPEERYPELESQSQPIITLRERLLSIDGVTAVGFSSTLPSVSGSEMTVQFPSSDLVPKVAWAKVTPGFFDALGLRLIEGSLLPEHVPGEPVLVVNQTFAKLYLNNQALGKTVLLGPRKPYQVVGVVSDVLQGGFLGETEAGLYYHYLQPPRRDFLHDMDRSHLLLRVRNSPSLYSSTLLGIVKGLDPQIRVAWIRPMNEILGEQIAQPRFWTILALSLSLLALAFSSIALYGLMSYNISQRVPEFAVRMAMGATSQELIRFVMRNALLIIGRGLLAGVILSLLVSALFADLLFGVVELQAITWIVGLAILISVALLAAYLPIRRGTDIDPAHSLRSS